MYCITLQTIMERKRINHSHTLWFCISASSCFYQLQNTIDALRERLIVRQKEAADLRAQYNLDQPTR
jgi:hypothetical protein